MHNHIFADRVEAGQLLAKRLAELNLANPTVLALPRGGVPVALEVAKVLQAPLDLLLVRKIGVPYQPELALGAVVDGDNPQVVINEDVKRAARVSDEEFEAIKVRELQEIERRRALYVGDRKRIAVEGTAAIVIDDGIATGATMLAALRALRQVKPKKLVLAVPVAPYDTIERLRAEVDEIVCLESPEPFYAIGLHYHDFGQVSDEEVAELLAESDRITSTREHKGAGS